MSRPKHSDDDVLPRQLQDGLMRALKPAELSAEQRDRLRGAVMQRARDTAPEGTTILRADARAWIEIAPLVQVRELRRDPGSGSHISLMRVRPGGIVPAHRHTQEEEFVILEGECHIGAHRLCVGDTHIADAGSWHGDVTTQSGVLVLIRGEYPYPAADRGA